MSNDIPDPVEESYTEDFSDIDTNIDELYERFIAPIENIRSQAVRPDINLNEIGNIKDNPGISVREIIKKAAGGIKPSDVLGYKIETRAHAFYRLIGLPVISKNKDKFYTPGFDPTANVKDQLDIISNMSESAMNASKEREQSYKDRISILSNQNLDSTLYFILLPYFSSNIQVLNKEKKDIFDKDEQTNKLDKLFELILPKSPENKEILINKHIIKPFIVDPLIENTVTPSTNIVSAPFLDKYINFSNLISKSQTATFAPPRLETIIRYRLSDTSKDKAEENQQFLNNFASVDNISSDYEETKKAVIDVLNNTSLKSLTSSTINNVNSKELIIIIKIYKTIKYLTDLLYENVTKLAIINNKITWQPLVNNPVTWPPPSDDNGVYNSTTITSDPQTELETTIYNLKIKKIEKEIFAKYSPRDEEQSEFREKKKEIDDYYEEYEGIRNKFVKAAGDCLRTIEIITGRHSGLGLIDILAIYSSLYAIEKKDLINLLDDASFNRLALLYPEYKTIEVFERYANGSPTKSIGDVMALMEEKIIIALEFAQKCYLNQSLTPIEGTPIGSKST